jgi:hypothetical protein
LIGFVDLKIHASLGEIGCAQIDHASLRPVLADVLIDLLPESTELGLWEFRQDGFHRVLLTNDRSGDYARGPS